MFILFVSQVQCRFRRTCVICIIHVYPTVDQFDLRVSRQRKSSSQLKRHQLQSTRRVQATLRKAHFPECMCCETGFSRGFYDKKWRRQCGSSNAWRKNIDSSNDSPNVALAPVVLSATIAKATLAVYDFLRTDKYRV